MIEPTSNAPAVSARNIAKSYGGVPVLSLNEVTFMSERVHVIVGPNGAGKTTLLRLIAGIERPDRGELRILGRDPWEQSRRQALALRRRVGFAAQKPYLFRTSVRRNVEYPLRVRGVSGPKLEELAQTSMKRLGVAHLAERNARTLSAGEAQRISITRATVTEPELLLLDEPLANIDPEGAPVIEELCRELESQGVTVIVATHVLEQAFRLSARVVRLEAGRMMPPAVENLLEGELIDAEDKAQAVLVLEGGLRLDVATERRGRARATIEPRDIVVSAESFRSSARNSLAGRVTKLEDRRGLVYVTADVGVPMVSIVTHQSFQEMGITVGSGVVFTFKATAVRVF